MRNALAEVIGSEWGSPFNCDLCMAFKPMQIDPCPYHNHKTWDEWLTEALKEWAWTILRAVKYTAHIQ